MLNVGGHEVPCHVAALRGVRLSGILAGLTPVRIWYAPSVSERKDSVAVAHWETLLLVGERGILVKPIQQKNCGYHWFC